MSPELEADLLDHAIQLEAHERQGKALKLMGQALAFWAAAENLIESGDEDGAIRALEMSETCSDLASWEMCRDVF